MIWHYHHQLCVFFPLMKTLSKKRVRRTQKRHKTAVIFRHFALLVFQVPRLTPLTLQGADGKLRSKVRWKWCEIGRNTTKTSSQLVIYKILQGGDVKMSQKHWCLYNPEIWGKMSQVDEVSNWLSFASPSWSYDRAMTWTTCQTAKTLWRAFRSNFTIWMGWSEG